MGVVDGGYLGAECAGVVKQVGEHVKDLHSGDEVIAFAEGSFASSLLTPAKLCAKMPTGVTFVEAATMPCVFATAIYSLLDIARLCPGDVSLFYFIFIFIYFFPFRPSLEEFHQNS